MPDCSLTNKEVYDEYLTVKKAIFDRINDMMPDIFSPFIKD